MAYATAGEADCARARFRSYVPMLNGLNNEQDIKIWEAAEATMAGVTYLGTTLVGPPDSRSINRIIGAKNPLRILMQEAEDKWSKGTFEDKLGCIVSIGLGIADFGESSPDFKRGLLHLEDSEREAQHFPKDYPSLAPIYFRFNVHHGLDIVELAEWGQTYNIWDATANYLKTETIREALFACGESLRASRTWPWSDIKDIDEKDPMKSAEDAFTTSPLYLNSGYSSGSSFFKSKLEHTKAEDNLFDIFTKDSELEPLYLVAIREIGSTQFQKNLILLLKRYCGWLCIIACTESEKSTVKFMRS